ncbi:MAG: mevalonate kinase [Nitrososphaerales archaeon]
MTAAVSASAPGKIILTGEHFVVHGSYAVAAGINRRVRVTVKPSKNGFSSIASGKDSSKVASEDGKFRAAKTIIRKLVQDYEQNSNPIEVQIDSDIPAGSGLGSSAAVSVACTAAITKYFGNIVSSKDLFALAMFGEKQVHGNPSGIDIEASISGGIILFNKSTGAKTIKTQNRVSLGVIYSGEKRSTSLLVAKVARQRDAHPNFFRNLTKSASYQSLELTDALNRGDVERIGTLFNIAQTELEWIGVSTPSIQKIIERVSGEGTYGAKITGAGGGGSIIVAAKPQILSSLINSLIANYPHSFVTQLNQEGLRWEP